MVCTMAVASLATAATFTVMETSNGNVFNVRYSSGQKGKVEVSILSGTNELLYKEKINSDGAFVRPYNFKGLPSGNYSIIIKDEVGEHNETITYSADKLISYSYVAAVPNQENKY